VVGIISDRDVIRAMSPYAGTAAETPRDEATLNRRAHQVMTRHPKCLSPSDGVLEAIRIMYDEQISSVLVVEDGKLKWIEDRAPEKVTFAE
jgi:acetoin utilization protein AcuB